MRRRDDEGDRRLSPTIVDEPPEELADVRAGRLPARYGQRLQDVFLDQLSPRLRPGVAILDVGSGRSPTIAAADRPPGCRYVGLDVSAHELRAAPPGAYQEMIVHDITRPLPMAAGHLFDVVISWQVLEHVKPLRAALDNLGRVLRPGGMLISQLSGTFAAFALLARIVPHRVRVRAMARFLGHSEDEKFPTYYDHCYASALERMLGDWSSVAVHPFYRGAVYFGMSRLLQRGYLRYESEIERRDLRNLATHYLVVATK